MIISHKHKFIFLKTAKTAGTSIEIALSKHCGPDDVITPIFPPDENTRRSLGYRGPQNYLASWREYGLRDIAKYLLRRERKKRYYHHISAHEVRLLVGDDIWNSYYKFCFERDPFDRLISHYFWSYPSEPRPPLADFIRSELPMMLKRRGFDVYTMDGQVVVDRVCRYEAIADELEEVRNVIGLPEPLVLPRAKSGYRTDKRHYSEVLAQEERDWITHFFGDEIRMFGYQFSAASDVRTGRSETDEKSAQHGIE
jgi:hypothetical protein